MNLRQHLHNTSASPDVQTLILAVSEAGKEIYEALKTQKIEYSTFSNSSGETQLSHDLIADKILKNALQKSEVVSCFVSEERASELCFMEHSASKLLVAFDPIDGSSVATSGLAVGTSVGIYQGVESFLGATGRDQVASMFLLYGPRVVLVYTVKEGVDIFALNENTGEFEHEQEDVLLMDGIKNCGIGGMQKLNEVPGYDELLRFWQKEKFSIRYSGSMAGDMNTILKKGGGVFCYPYPKLRLLYECNPFALLIEQAGGKARDIRGENILDLKIEKIESSSPIIIGALKEVEDAGEIFLKYFV
jgi:fructose-1,6-bisphosphatase I